MQPLGEEAIAIRQATRTPLCAPTGVCRTSSPAVRGGGEEVPAWCKNKRRETGRACGASYARRKHDCNGGLLEDINTFSPPSRQQRLVREDLHLVSVARAKADPLLLSAGWKVPGRVIDSREVRLKRRVVGEQATQTDGRAKHGLRQTRTVTLSSHCNMAHGSFVDASSPLIDLRHRRQHAAVPS
ncbi:unnamed protein product [Cercospora beticola]|nr:unnamed protein product [Cercospora beticola]